MPNNDCDLDLKLYDTKTFVQIWVSASDFWTDYQTIPTDMKILAEGKIKTLFYLLFARYGNSPIANFDETQFKYRVWSIIYTYGAEWVKKLDIQDKLRALTDDDLLSGGEGIYNHASNPSVAPSTGLTDELAYVDDQNVQKRKRSKLEAYQFLWDALKSNITDEFLNRFQPLFAKFVSPYTHVYRNCDDEEN